MNRENNHVIFVDIGDKINLIESELVSQFEAQLSANKIMYLFHLLFIIYIK